MPEGLAGIARIALAVARRCQVALLLASTGLAATFGAENPDGSHEWRIGIEDSNPPLSYSDSRGQPDGFARDLVEAILTGAHLKPVYVVKHWPELYQDFLDGRIDVLASASYSPGRQGELLLSAPYFERREALFLRAGLAHRNGNGLQGLRLAAVDRSASFDYLASQGLGDDLVAVTSIDEGLRAVEEGRIDGVLGYRTTGFRRMRDLGLRNVRIHDFNIPGIAGTVHFGVRPGQAWRLPILNAGLERLRSDGTYRQLREQWYGAYEAGGLVFADLIPYLVPGVLLVVILATAFVGQRLLFKRAAESEERLNRVLEGSRLAYWDWDLRKGGFVVSDRWHQLLGDEPGAQRVEPDSLVHAAAASHASAVKAALDGLRDRGVRVDLVFQTPPARGSHWLHLLGTAQQCDPSGRSLRAAGTLADITERMNAAEALNLTQAQYRRTADLLRLAEQAAHIGAWELDPGSSRIQLSDEAARLLRLDPGASPLDIATVVAHLSPESSVQAEAAIRRLISNQTSFDLELTLPSIPGQSSVVRWIGLAEGAADGTTQCYGSIQDITDRRRMENERAATQRRLLEAQRREGLGALAGGVAHDFNNLLTVILSNASLARLDAPASHPGADPLAQIERAATRAADLCRQMLIYAGQATIDPKPVSVPDLLDEMRGLIDVTVGRRNRLILEPGPRPAAVLADHRQLRQLILSIVQNAAEACAPEGGTVRITCSVAVLSSDVVAELRPRFETDPGSFVCIAITDDGVGMSAEVLSRVFEPFFSTKFAGRGLGLAAAHGIVKAHHGAIAIESEPHRGTTFRIFLPLIPGSATGSHPTRVRPSERPAELPRTTDRGSGKAVLVADDDASIRTVVAMLSMRLGYRCTQASDGSEALTVFSGDPGSFSVVLIDVTMPGLPAQELAGRIREIRPDIRIILMGGYQDPAESNIPTAAGVMRLQKPFTANELASALGQSANQVS